MFRCFRDFGEQACERSNLKRHCTLTRRGQHHLHRAEGAQTVIVCFDTCENFSRKKKSRSVRKPLACTDILGATLDTHVPSVLLRRWMPLLAPAKWGPLSNLDQPLWWKHHVSLKALLLCLPPSASSTFCLLLPPMPGQILLHPNNRTFGSLLVANIGYVLHADGSLPSHRRRGRSSADCAAAPWNSQSPPARRSGGMYAHSALMLTTSTPKW
jgi:hypothetical protein